MTENQLRFFRDKQKLSQTDLAVKSGVKQSTISSIERGVDPTGRTLRKLAQALNVTTDELLNMKEVTK
ncbi:hypothetical protein G8J22_02418 [Lentilactobacillus hilgardii]|uniref:DNA-binding helix-turn-helix protein n=1 Tax=Lentilactobacillus hilgardii (strain ATCC 8290 / DSM 20176 / CCUG 30140 / JCM 1155 / KCTC 3500 / NBRC 15886 / NCIMB 8040 / NRRL B-1843 / 9) TaxID=1423757 RepID=C0XGP0_LENH9|nr:helix-turn-helix transcriptional regulator [Lentilactobacillus hilgardii]EEI19604.1 DNA-binding helix-turn-helix protein [Lentilactobacillus buchneri ATCC 11577]EEI25452.1 DNA-binding helix-turn-helix protein [Lentilactobacillus hilgardii DSM 20176 = ATCC 8290]KRK56818.1 hypothetical protein FD42_GL002549 [Lentilactobacillus hilgardii DSM 20176 = ATCC 8290]QEU39407.1 helix-turn-helix transcriptional regulator [Lentilactobacillus hilgardii]QIR10410.1 hypothetical protein G8J22_02418 [Lentila